MNDVWVEAVCWALLVAAVGCITWQEARLWVFVKHQRRHRTETAPKRQE